MCLSFYLYCKSVFLKIHNEKEVVLYMTSSKSIETEVLFPKTEMNNE